VPTPVSQGSIGDLQQEQQPWVDIVSFSSSPAVPLA
jgi:hypothetical protein